MEKRTEQVFTGNQLIVWQCSFLATLDYQRVSDGNGDCWVGFPKEDV